MERSLATAHLMEKGWALSDVRDANVKIMRSLWLMGLVVGVGGGREHDDDCPTGGPMSDQQYEQQYQDHLESQYQSQERDYLKAKVDGLARALARHDPEHRVAIRPGLVLSECRHCEDVGEPHAPDCVYVWAIEHVAALEGD